MVPCVCEFTYAFFVTQYFNLNETLSAFEWLLFDFDISAEGFDVRKSFCSTDGRSLNWYWLTSALQ